MSRDISSQVIANAAKLGIDAIITIGGDGSQKIGYDSCQFYPINGWFPRLAKLLILGATVVSD